MGKKKKAGSLWKLPALSVVPGPESQIRLYASWMLCSVKMNLKSTVKSTVIFQSVLACGQFDTLSCVAATQ
jgi:hypothetical protein